MATSTFYFYSAILMVLESYNNSTEIYSLILFADRLNTDQVLEHTAGYNKADLRLSGPSFQRLLPCPTSRYHANRPICRTDIGWQYKK
jgi:hypothetical protein